MLLLCLAPLRHARILPVAADISWAVVARRALRAYDLVRSMTDTRTPDQRRRIMAAVRTRDTTPELRLRKALYALGVRGWRCHYRRAPGKPDLAWPARKVAVFVDGAFWHGHPSRHRPGRSGDYWDHKIARNVERDREVDRELDELGWVVERIWDFEIRHDLEAVAQRVATLAESRTNLTL